MNKEDIIRAWKDPEYRASLSDAERAALPAHPAGLIELTDGDLGGVVGGALYATRPCMSYGCCDHTLTVGSCRVATLGCCGYSAAELVDDVAIFIGLGALDGDNELTQDEYHVMQDAVADLQANPVLTDAQIHNIVEVADVLYETLDGEMRANLEQAVNQLQADGQLSAEQLDSLVNTVNSIQFEGLR